MLPLSLFHLNPAITFLNHGSFGATPRPVLEAQHAWQRRLEAEPVRFLGRDLFNHLAAARAALGTYLHASSTDLAFIPNATYGVNLVARSLKLRPGDQILTTNHEYGACARALRFICEPAGVQLRTVSYPLPPISEPEWLEEFWSFVTPATRLIFISHITSPTALTLPMTAICSRARQAGVLTLIDGAHAPGQIDLDIPALQADFYTGNCHKWLLAPKGSGFLYAHPRVQAMLEPLVVSWGWQPEPAFGVGNPFLDYIQWPGTHDPSAYLAVPAALQFQTDHDWPTVRRYCHVLLEDALAHLHELTGCAPLVPPGQSYYQQMGILRLPPGLDPAGLQKQLYDQFLIEVPCFTWNGISLLRLSIQGYNSPADIDTLHVALKELIVS